MRKNLVLNELFILLGLLLVALFIMGSAAGFSNLIKWEVDFQLHDTVFVATPLLYVFTLFLLLAYLTYLTRIVLARFRSRIQSLILLVVSGLLVIVLTIHLRLLSSLEFMGGGWTIYPPLSDLPEEPVRIGDNGYTKLNNGLIIFQAIIVSTMVFVGIRPERRNNS